MPTKAKKEVVAKEVATQKTELKEVYEPFAKTPPTHGMITSIDGVKVNLRPFEIEVEVKGTASVPPHQVVIPAATQEQLERAFEIGYKNVRKVVK